MSCLTPGAAKNLLLSGSWDHTAIVWELSGVIGRPVVKLVGHENAVWSIAALKNGNIVTGGADTFIIYWSRTGEKLKVLKGHKECVRGLVILPDDSLVSASNDGVVKVWNVDGECVNNLYGHSNYIYSLAHNTFIGHDVFLSCSEDSTIRMWNPQGPLGSITLPAQSVWCVTANPTNGDIVTASSDGIVRVFTKDPARYASDATVAAFDMAVEVHVREAQLSLGGVKVQEIPG